MEELIKDYQNLYTIKELSQKYHITQGDVKKILKNKDIYIRTAAETWILKRNKGFSLEQIESIVVDNYVNKKFGQLKSGRQFGLSDRTVKNILLKNNIQIRNLHESICVANQTNDRTTQYYEKNPNFFKEENSNMAWLLGFLASDGNISKNGNRIRIELSVVDKEILERIKEIVKIENPIKIRENKRGFVFASLDWSCAEHKKDLEKYNIIPQKTYTLLPPTKLNEKFYIDYIRGYFDGDGTIYQRSNGRYSFGFVGTPDMIKNITEYLYKNLDLTIVKTYSKGNPQTVEWKKEGNQAIECAKFLYKDATIYLDRKYQKICPFME